MRYLLIVLCIFCAVASAESIDIQAKKDVPPVTGKAEGSDKKNDQTKAKQEITVNLPSSVNVSLGGKLDITSQNKQTGAYEESSKWVDPITWFTLVLAVANILLWWTTKNSVDLARDEFVSTHRPIIRIKHVYITSEVWGGKPIEIELVIVNSGITPAIIRHMNLETTILSAGKQLPPRPDFSEPDKTISREKVDSGFSIALPKMTIRELSMDDHPRLMDGTKKLYCYGHVEYSDAAGRIRKTAFCRIWEPPTGTGALNEPGRFVKYDDPDYEYED